MSRFIVTVDRAGIDKGTDEPIRILNTRTWATHTVAEAHLYGDVVIKHGPEREDGATVWIECDGYW